jgi:ketosteroid isomerase-like protein
VKLALTANELPQRGGSGSGHAASLGQPSPSLRDTRAQMDAEANVEAVRRMWDAYYKRGLPAVLEFAAADAEWRPYSARGRVFRSTAEYQGYIREMKEREEVVEATLREIHAHGDCVVVSGRLRIRGREGVVDNPMHWVHRFGEDGLIVFTASFPNLEAALGAAGLDGRHRIET